MPHLPLTNAFASLQTQLSAKFAAPANESPETLRAYIRTLLGPAPVVPPQLITAPTLAPTGYSHQLLEVIPGTYSGYPDITITGRWSRVGMEDPENPFQNPYNHYLPAPLHGQTWVWVEHVHTPVGVFEYTLPITYQHTSCTTPLVIAETATVGASVYYTPGVWDGYPPPVVQPQFEYFHEDGRGWTIEDAGANSDEHYVVFYTAGLWRVRELAYTKASGDRANYGPYSQIVVTV